MFDINNRKIIINNDFDGILCGEILKDLYNCEIVGFTNSKDKLHLINGHEFTGDELFIDMFTPYYDSMDQHIPPCKYEKSFCPNKERERYAFDNYVDKYPYSTYIWILIDAARKKLDIEPYIKTKTLDKDNFSRFDILLRADDSLLNYIKYNRNAKEWANYILSTTNNNKHLKTLFDYFSKQDREYVEAWKKNMDSYFKTKYGFKAEEIPNIESDMAKQFMSRFGINFENITKTIDLEHHRTTIRNKKEFDDLCDKFGTKLFSFAFIYGPNKTDKNNFSYSLLITSTA